MAEMKKIGSLYKNIIGDTKSTIEAITRYLAKNPPEETNAVETPAESINRILNSITSEETKDDIQKIINNL